MGKYIWVHFDEKWFYALVARNNAKCCPENGVRKSFSSVHHKSHVAKVMCIAVCGFAFDGDVEDGGEGLKICFDRCQAARVAERTQWEMQVDPETGKKVANKTKEPLRQAGDVWFQDVNVTGSDEGNSKFPKFSLKSYFSKKVLPVLDIIVGSGARHEGYKIILQGDNAPGHAESGFTAWLESAFTDRGWYIENQAPQSPYTNVNDLAVFPAMAKRHTHRLAEKYGHEVPSPDHIWEAALEIWKEMDSICVARSFIQARRIHDIIVRDGGKQRWLSNGGPHCNCRRDFKDGHDGVSVWPRKPGEVGEIDEYLPFREKTQKRLCKKK